MPHDREPRKTADQEKLDEKTPDADGPKEDEEGLGRQSEMESEGRRARPSEEERR
jgi:hypothetical protein